ncbi:MAG: MFS transporter, partial [Pseudomonas sp.]|nr:MFS transporter [Pseudomonas sp.]
GGVAEGRFLGLDSEGKLIIRRVIRGPGLASYNLAPGEIVLLELVEP